MTSAYDDVVAALPQLTPDERGRVAERLKLLGAFVRAQPAPPAAGMGEDAAGAADELLGVICEVVLRLSGERISPAALRRIGSFGAFQAKAQDLGAFAVKSTLTRVQRRALLVVGVELLYHDLARAGFSVTARTLMACAHQIPAVVDKAFPGYAHSGLLGMVVGIDPPKEGM